MHVLVSDPDTATTRSIEAVLTDAGHEVTFAESAIEVFRRLIVDWADAVILETELPDLGGIRLCHELRTHRYTGIIMFVAHDDDSSTKVAAFNAGADDYLVKPFVPAELRARLASIEQRMLRYADRKDGAVVTVGQATLSLGDLTYRVAGREPVLLTPTEMRVLELLMRHAEATVSRETLIDHVWGFSFEGDTNRVDVYVRRLRQKIEAIPGEPEYLHTVRSTGYVFSSPDDRIVSERPARPFDGTSDDAV